MTEDALLKFAYPMLVGIGLIVVLNIWNIFQFIWSRWKSKDERLEKLEGLVIKLSFEIENLQKDVNNLGQILRETRNERKNP